MLRSIMRAAVIHKLGDVPKYLEFPVPVPSSGQKLVKVLASTVKNLDRGIVSGKHYASYKNLPTAVGIDGVGILEETGELIYSQGITGFIAEKALVQEGKYVVLDKDTDPAIAAAVPNVILGAEMAMTIRGKLKAGDVVLINGATGVTGKFAAQLAKIHGARKVIATGRDIATLELMKTSFGVDEIIHLEDSNEKIVERVQQIFNETPIDLVLDYLWGTPIENIIRGIISTKKYHPTKIVSIGEIAGANINLPSSVLRSSALEIIGSGIGSFEPGFIEKFIAQSLPSILSLVKQGKLKIDTNQIDIKDIEQNWFKDVKGKRTVVKIN